MSVYKELKPLILVAGIVLAAYSIGHLLRDAIQEMKSMRSSMSESIGSIRSLGSDW